MVDAKKRSDLISTAVLFIVVAISREPLPKVARAALPFLAISALVLMMVAYVPQLTLFLPSLFR